MALHIRGAKADALVRKLAAARGIGLTEAIELAVQNQIQQDEEFDTRLRRLQDRVASYPKTGLKADKAFYDSLNDE
jgi:antitoxin VapB